MTSFPLKIVTPDGLIFDGEAEELVVRSTTGDVAVLAKHTNFVTPLGMGRAIIVSGGIRRTAACIGGMLSVVNGSVTLVPTTFEWSDKIDLERADAAYQRANAILKNPQASENDLKLAEAKLRRALVRKSVASNKYRRKSGSTQYWAAPAFRFCLGSPSGGAKKFYFWRWKITEPITSLSQLIKRSVRVSPKLPCTLDHLHS